MPKAKDKSLRPEPQTALDANMTPSTFRLWSELSLKSFLELRGKSTDGDHEHLVARYARHS